MIDPIGTFTLEDLQRMERSAWYESARAWSEYHAAVREYPEDLGLSNMLNESAWSAHHFWVKLHYELKARKDGA